MTAVWDATSSVVTPPEVALLQKRIQFRRMLPCLDFEDLDRKRMEMDESRYLFIKKIISKPNFFKKLMFPASRFPSLAFWEASWKPLRKPLENSQ